MQLLADSLLDVRLAELLGLERQVSDHGEELRESAEGKPDSFAQARGFVWRHRRFFAPLFGVLAAKLCPMLGWAAGPCAVLGDLLRDGLSP